jgi:integrase
MFYILLRNKAIISLMLHCGLRVSEIINLRSDSINLTKGKPRIEAAKINTDLELP